MVHSPAGFGYDAGVRRKALPILTVVRLAPALLAIGLYAITLYGTYVYDDLTIVQQDPRVRLIHRWKELWTTDYFNGGVDNLYRPIVSSSYALQWFIHGDRPWYFHAVNILLHALVCMAVAEFTRRCLSNVNPRAAHFTQAPTEVAWRRRGPFQGESLANASALYAGLLFAAHPIHVEAVANIVGRAELLCALAALGGLIVLARRPLTAGRIAAALLLAIVGLLSKEHGLLQPLLWLFFMVLIWPGLECAGVGLERGIAACGFADRARPDSRSNLRQDDSASARSGATDLNNATTVSKRERSALKILLLLVSWVWAGYIIAREHFLKFEWDRSFLDPNVQPMIHSTGIDRVLMPIVLLGRYTLLLFWPARLSVDYGADVIGSIVHLSDPYFWIGLLAVIILVFALFRLTVRFFRGPTPSPGTPGEGGGEGLADGEPNARIENVGPHPNPLPEYRERGPERCANRRFFLFCLLSLGVTYALIGNIVTLIGTIFAERIAYLPSAFAVILLAMLIARLPRNIGAGLMIVLLALCSIRTVTWARDWNDPLTLYRASLENCPRSLQLHFLVAQEYHNAADEPDAQAVMADATDMYPRFWQAWMQRASHALDAGRLEDAAEYLRTAQALEANPRLLEVRGRLNRMVDAKNRAKKTR